PPQSSYRGSPDERADHRNGHVRREDGPYTRAKNSQRYIHREEHGQRNDCRGNWVQTVIVSANAPIYRIGPGDFVRFTHALRRSKIVFFQFARKLVEIRVPLRYDAENLRHSPDRIRRGGIRTQAVSQKYQNEQAQGDLEVSMSKKHREL